MGNLPSGAKTKTEIVGGLIIIPVVTVILGINIIEDVSLGELIAICVTILGFIIASGIAIFKWKREQRRKSKLINFPIDNWKAYRRKQQGKLELQIYAEVYIPYHSFSCKVITKAEGEVIAMNYKAETSPFKRERCIVTGQSDLTDILKQAKSVTTSMVIELDGEFKKSSEKITVDIEDA